MTPPSPSTPHKVRMQSGTMESYTKRKSCAKFFRQIYREEGVRGLYRVSGTLLFGRRYPVLISLSPLPPLPPFPFLLPPAPLPTGCGSDSTACCSDSRSAASFIRLLQETHFGLWSPQRQHLHTLLVGVSTATQCNTLKNH